MRAAMQFTARACVRDSRLGMTVFENPYEPPRAQDVEELEAMLGVLLPPEYRSYLLEKGGGHLPIRGYFPVEWPKGYAGFSSGKWVWFSWFLRIEKSVEVSIYDAIDNVWREEFGWPKELLPFAESDAGGIVFIGLRGAHRGRVYFGYTNDTQHSGPTWSIVASAAPTFSAWQASLVPETEVPA
jgi:hypothetical protein